MKIATSPCDQPICSSCNKLIVFLAWTLALGVQGTLANVTTYDGGENGRWVVAGNWNDGVAPSADDALRFNNGVNSAVAQNWTVDSISFTGSVTHGFVANSTTPYTARLITLNATNLNANGNTDTISVVGTGTLRVGGSLDRGVVNIVLGASTSHTFGVGVDADLVFEAGRSAISGTDKSLVFTGPGALTLASANSFGGVGQSFTMNSGTLNLNHTSALGSVNNTFVINGGTLNNTSAGALILANHQQVWNADFSFAGSRNLNLGSGAVTLGGDVAVEVVQSNLTVGGSINDGNNGYDLVKTGAGNLILNGQVTNTGRAEIRAGTLTLGSSAALTSPQIVISNGATLNVSALSGGLILTSGQTLSGHGTVQGNTTLDDGATLSPGSSYGIFTMSNLTLAAGSKVDLEIGGNTAPGVDYDQVVSTGSLTYEDGAILRVTFQNAVDNPLSLTLKVMDFASYSGAVGPQIELVGQADDISYNKDTGELTFLNASIVPEPGTLMLMLGAGSLLVFYRRRAAS